MDITKMKTVLSVAKTHSFSETAFEISLSQSSVSKHIASVEEELGVLIFSRSKSGKSVELTREGALFVRYASDIVASYDQLCRSIAQLSDSDRVPFTVSTIPIPIYGTFSQSALISSFYIRYPQIDLKIVNYSQTKLMDALLKNKIDAAVVRVLVENGTVLPPESCLYDARFRVDEICENPCLVAISEKHRLSGRDFLTLEDLKDENILLQRPVVLPGANETAQMRYKLFIQSCVNAGFEPKMISAMDPSVHQGEIAFDLVKRGHGVMVIHVRVQEQIPGIRQLPLHGISWSARTIVVSRNNTPRWKVEQLICILKELLLQ